MLENTETIAALGRLLIGGAFVVAGVRNIRAFGFLTEMVRKTGLPVPASCLAIAIATQIAGGAAFAAGIGLGPAVVALCIFVALATVLFHNFWSFQGPERVEHVNAFIGNSMITGGLLLGFAATV